MATRFHFDATNTPSVFPVFNANWEQTGQAVRRKMVYTKMKSVISALADSVAITVPITTTQDILCVQFVSDPLPTGIWGRSGDGLFQLVIKAVEDAISTKATLAYVISVCEQGGSSPVAMFQQFGTDTEFPITTAETRKASSTFISTEKILPGQRLILEIGARATAPTLAGTFTLRFGSNASSDFAFTTGLTTDLNPWFEVPGNLYERVNLPRNNLRPRIFAPCRAR